MICSLKGVTSQVNLAHESCIGARTRVPGSSGLCVHGEHTHRGKPLLLLQMISSGNYTASMRQKKHRSDEAQRSPRDVLGQRRRVWIRSLSPSDDVRDEWVTQWIQDDRKTSYSSGC